MVPPVVIILVVRMHPDLAKFVDRTPENKTTAPTSSMRVTPTR
jgi:hypothetical protein